jgi:DNA-binding SARP family transcriptional activator
VSADVGGRVDSAQARPRRLEIALFGHLRLAVDGVPFAMSASRKALQLFSFLALAGRGRLYRDAIARELWPDEESEESRTRLRASIYDLQRALPPPRNHWLILEGESIAWNPAADIRIDVVEFEAAARDPARAREAADWYRGDLIESAYDDFIVAPRERLRTLYERVLERLFADARRRRAHAEATEWARAMLASDPWREDVVRRLMSVRFEAGDRAGAIAEYRRFAADLQAEIGVDPMPETQALFRSIVRGDAAVERIAGDGDDTATSVRERERLPLFASQAAALEAVLAAAASHEAARVIAIDGPLGAGISRLADEIVHAFEARGVRVLRGATSRPESGPIESLIDALRSALPTVAALKLPKRERAMLAELLPEFGGDADVAIASTARIDDAASHRSRGRRTRRVSLHVRASTRARRGGRGDRAHRASRAASPYRSRHRALLSAARRRTLGRDRAPLRVGRRAAAGGRSLRRGRSSRLDARRACRSPGLRRASVRFRRRRGCSAAS